ncbi:AP-3 complex subunit mu [Monosporozyma unispora]|nr:AP-3 complex subunit mu [Kazachstania unispora]
MYISFYITDSRNGLIFQYLPSNDAPSFKNLWTRIQSTCPQLGHTRIDGVEDEFIYQRISESNIQTYTHSLVGKDLEVFKYYSHTNNLYYWCLVSRSSDITQPSHGFIMEPHILMEEIDEMLLDYFNKDKITVKKIVNNYDQITLIFNCCVNGGEPMTGGMYMNRVKSIIPMKSDFSKVINSTAHTIQNAVARRQYPSNGQIDNASKMFSSMSGDNKSGSPFTQDVEVVPWRSNKIMEDKNEFYLDIKETMSIVMEKGKSSSKKRTSHHTGFKLVNGKITGTLDCRSYLGGTPLVSVNLNNCGYDFGFPSLHDCVEIDQFDSKDTTLSFIPPNGKFKLMKYNLNLAGNEKVKNWNQLGIVSIDYMNNLGAKEDEFEVTVNIGSSRKVNKIRDLDIELQFVNQKKGIDKSHHKIRILRSTHGRFNQMANQERGNWLFDSEMATGTTAILRGCIESQDSEEMSFAEEEVAQEEVNHASKATPGALYKLNRVVIRYNHEGETLSGIAVNAIKADTHSSSSYSGNSNSSSNIKVAFKGVKYLSCVQAAEMRTY